MTSLPHRFLPTNQVAAFTAICCGAALVCATLSAATTDVLSASNRFNIKVFSQASDAPNLSFDPAKPGFTVSRAEGPVRSCHVAIPLVPKGAAPVRLVRTGDSLGVRLGVSYRPWVGPYAPNGPRLMLMSTPWVHDLANGKYLAPVGSLEKVAGYGLLLGQNNEIANFWLRPVGGKNWPNSSRNGQTAGPWPRSLLDLPVWKDSAPVEMIFSLTKLEGSRLRYYGFCAGVEHEVEVFDDTPFVADFLWLDLSTSNAKEICFTTVEVMSP